MHYILATSVRTRHFLSCVLPVPDDLTPEEQQELENIRRRKLELLEDIQVSLDWNTGDAVMCICARTNTACKKKTKNKDSTPVFFLPINHYNKKLDQNLILQGWGGKRIFIFGTFCGILFTFTALSYSCESSTVQLNICHFYIPTNTVQHLTSSGMWGISCHVLSSSEN